MDIHFSTTVCEYLQHVTFEFKITPKIVLVMRHILEATLIPSNKIVIIFQAFSGMETRIFDDEFAVLLSVFQSVFRANRIFKHVEICSSIVTVSYSTEIIIKCEQSIGIAQELAVSEKRVIPVPVKTGRNEFGFLKEFSLFRISMHTTAAYKSPILDEFSLALMELNPTCLHRKIRNGDFFITFDITCSHEKTTLSRVAATIGANNRTAGNAFMVEPRCYQEDSNFE